MVRKISIFCSIFIYFSFLDSHNDVFIEDRIRIKRNVTNSLSPTSAEQHRVREMIDRLESTSSNSKGTRKILAKKSFHEDYSDGSTSFSTSPPMKRTLRREKHESNITNGSNGSFVFQRRSPHDEIYFRDNNSSNITRFELDRDEIINNSRRTASGTTVS